MAKVRSFTIPATGLVLALALSLPGVAPAEAGPPVGATAWVNAHAPVGLGNNELRAVSCGTASFCVAVGSQSEETGGGVLVEVWDGTSWTRVTGVSVPPSANDSLTGVSCVGTSFCAAVGSDAAGVLTEMWNGSSWTQLDAPEPPGYTGGAFLSSVSCVTATRCQALGTGFASTTAHVFGELWNGTSWSLVPAATPAASGSPPVVDATGMDCVTAADCIAVGTTDVQASDGVPFAEHWDGSSWSLVDAGVDPGLPGGSALSAVSCVGASSCQAVGWRGGSTTQNLIETWNGSRWTVDPSVPQTSPTESQALTGVDCISATSCSAVGWADAASSPSPASLALTWDGTGWSIVPHTPNAGGVLTALAAETCLTDWACVAVGKFGTGGSPANVGAFAMTTTMARSGYRLVASDGGVFAYGAGAPFLGSAGSLPLNRPIVSMAVMPAGDGYDLVASDGGVFTYGSARFYGSTGSLTLNKPIVGMALTPDGAGYWLVASDGGIFSFGDAPFDGSTGGMSLNEPIVGMAAPTAGGYDLVASDGGIFSFGDAPFDGSTGSLALQRPIVGMTAVAGGYYLAGADGGVFAFPTSAGPPFLGSTGSLTLDAPIVGLAG